MKLQLSPVRKLDDALTVWDAPGATVDIVLDVTKPLPFRPGSIKHIYAFGAVGKTPFRDVPALLKNWHEILVEKGQVYIIEPDFEYLIRNVITADLLVEQFNADFVRSSYITKDLIAGLLREAGFPVKDQRQWFDGIKFVRQNHELVLSASKTKEML